MRAHHAYILLVCCRLAALLAAIDEWMNRHDYGAGRPPGPVAPPSCALGDLRCKIVEVP